MEVILRDPLQSPFQEMGVRTGKPTSPGVGGGLRTLDVAGPELVTNGQFPSNIVGWTDASTAGGAIAWNSGAMRVTNTSATARARQTITNIAVGQRYSFFALNPRGTVGMGTSVGSTTPGSLDYLSALSNPAIPARAGVKEFVAVSATVQLTFAAAVAGYFDVDNVTLRNLTPTTFPRGTVFSDDFSLKADGPLGVTPDNLAWREMVPQNGVHVYPRIESGKMAVSASGDASGITASYPYLHMGNGKVAGIHCDVQWSGDAGVAMVSVQPPATLPTVSNITTNSLHIVFTSTSVAISTFVAGVKSTDEIVYTAPAVTDGRTYVGVGWALTGDTLTVTMPDGTTAQRTDTRFSQVQGCVAIPEIFYSTASPGPATISKVAVVLG